jgi:acetyl esterase/lipase
MRRRSIVLVIVGLLVAGSACQIQTIRPSGDGPLRYRDEIFTQVSKTADIPYGSAINEQGQNQTLLLDLYVPTGDTVPTRPAIVWVHGGSFRSGSKTSPEIVDEANTFARKGFVNASISYRLSATGCSASLPTAECIQAIVNAKYDAQAAVRYLRANAAAYGIDPDRIAIAGSSAGAITALNVAYGPEDPGTSGTPGQPSTVSAAVSLSGAALLTLPNAGEPPVLLLHGTADVVVPYSWAQTTVDRAHAAGTQAYLTSWEGLGHVPYVQKRTEILDQTTNFLYWTMRLVSAER